MIAVVDSRRGPFLYTKGISCIMGNRWDCATYRALSAQNRVRQPPPLSATNLDALAGYEFVFKWQSPFWAHTAPPPADR